LQTFPDDYRFEGSKESVRKQIGMAVPVEAARIVFEALLKTYAGVTYGTVEPNIGCFSPAEHVMDAPNDVAQSMWLESFRVSQEEKLCR
jgi:DNA (cytosine-5)-methyltransferase 1